MKRPAQYKLQRKECHKICNFLQHPHIKPGAYNDLTLLANYFSTIYAKDIRHIVIDGEAKKFMLLQK